MTTTSRAVCANRIRMIEMKEGDGTFHNSIAYKHGVPKQVWINYRRARKALGASHLKTGFFTRCRLSPNTTFAWKHETFDECVREAWAQSCALFAGKPLTLKRYEQIYPIMHDVFGVSKEDLLRDLRDRAIGYVRFTLMNIAHAHGVPPAAIARHACKDHHTVMYALREFGPRFLEIISNDNTGNGGLALDGQGERGISTPVHAETGGNSGGAQG